MRRGCWLSWESEWRRDIPTVRLWFAIGIEIVVDGWAGGPRYCCVHRRCQRRLFGGQRMNFTKMYAAASVR